MHKKICTYRGEANPSNGRTATTQRMSKPRTSPLKKAAKQAGEKPGNLRTRLPANLALCGRILGSCRKILGDNSTRSQNLSARSQNPSAKHQIGWELGYQVPGFFPSLPAFGVFQVRDLKNTETPYFCT